MRFKAALFYDGKIAFYSIYFLNKNFYKAKLDEYSGEATPPPLVELVKEPVGWASDCVEKELVKELGAAIDQRISA